MSGDALTALAAEAGLAVDWEDAGGGARTVAPDALRAILTALGLPCGNDRQCRESRAALAADPPPPLVTGEAGAPIAIAAAPGRARLRLEDGTTQEVVLARAAEGATIDGIATPGYHRLELPDREVAIAVAPRRCVSLSEITGGRRAWGTAVQLYGLRGERARGFGDFGALADWARAAGRAGADALAISPVHALFLAEPDRASPYSPSSRDFLNPLYADPAALDSDEDEHEGGELIDWAEAAPVRIERLRAVFDRVDAAGDQRLDRFVAEGGEALRSHALFEALHGHFVAGGTRGGWQAWPAAFHDPASPAVAEFAREHEREVRFQLFLQWLTATGLGAAQAAAREADMAVGLVSDLAVGLNPGGSHGWSRRGELLDGLGVGAPPDAFQAEGQGWGITNFAPRALSQMGFEPFLRTLRAQLAHAGGVRIDHALGLGRLWVIPNGASPLDGAYLSYPLDDLLRLIALESHRAGALVIGEDLGTVPPGLRAALDAHGLLGMRVLPFERDKAGAFTSSASWDVAAAAMTGTHDLPPVAGWWRGRDIEWRRELGAAGDRAAEEKERAADRAQLWARWREDGAVSGPEPAPEDPAPAVDGAVTAVAEAASDLAIVPVEDLAGAVEAPNLPGTVDEHPNWRRRYPQTPAAFFADPPVAARVALLSQARPR